LTDTLALPRERGKLVPVPVFLALAAGLLWAACFGKHEMAFAPWSALAPFLYLIARLPAGPRVTRRAAALGFAHGLGAWTLGIWWIAPTLDTFGQIGGFLSALGLLLVAVKRGSLTTALPFGVFLALGAIAALFWGPAAVELYRGAFR